MRIGIDIDGVLTDIEQWQLDYLHRPTLSEYATVWLFVQYLRIRSSYME